MNLREQIGDKLKAARESLNISIEEAAAAAGLDVNTVRALEEGDFSGFKNKVYGRAYLRDYANFLKAEAEPLIAMYEDSLPKPEPEPETGNTPGEKTCLWVVIVLIAIILIITFLFRTPRKETPMPFEPKVEKPAPKPEPKPEPEVKPEVKVMTLTVTAKADVYYKLRTPENGEKAGLLKAGESVKTESPTKIYIKLSDPAKAALTLNGAAKPLATPEKVFLAENLFK
ncbi:MAG: helix-turn-helix domain-containing protein [Abditibacteriota bacterium]|nr:helix-turn-helix domain-containing protein [Abditibacteriota bacterium]